MLTPPQNLPNSLIKLSLRDLKSDFNCHQHTGSSVWASDWSPSTLLQTILGTLRWFCRATAEFSVWSGSSRTGSRSRLLGWRFFGAERPQRRPACPPRAPWRSVVLREDQRTVQQRTQCTTTTHWCLQTVQSSTVTTTSRQNQTLLPGGLDTVD